MLLSEFISYFNPISFKINQIDRFKLFSDENLAFKLSIKTQHDININIKPNDYLRILIPDNKQYTNDNIITIILKDFDNNIDKKIAIRSSHTLKYCFKYLNINENIEVFSNTTLLSNEMKIGNIAYQFESNVIILLITIDDI